MTQILEGLSKIISESSWLAPILALFAGVLTSFTPCSLSGIPLVIGYVGGTGQRSTKKAFWLSVTFTLGVAVTFTTLGASASIAGRLIGTSASWWYIILGILMLLMALQTWGIYEIIPSSYLLSKNTRRNYLGAFIAGVLGGVCFTLLHACTYRSPCYCSWKRKRFMGNTTIATVFNRSWHSCYCSWNVYRLCAKAFFKRKIR